MKFTGERLIPGIQRLENMIVEELSRLNFVRPYFAGRVVLDAGCGLGYGTQFLAESGARWVLGIDISKKAIRYAAENYQRDNLAFGVMDCTRLGLKDESFDMICSIELIEHLAQVDQYLVEVCRVLRPQGLYFMSTPNRKVSSTSSGKASWAFHEREFDLDELRELLETYFEEVEIWGSYVPVYEHHPIRKVTKSPLSQIKHILPPKIRVWISSSIRFWIKPNLSFDDVVFSKENIEEMPTFIALCGRKRSPSKTK
jgi:ubiquinone/menaquinone biosynthesis C-methylase UbiE